MPIVIMIWILHTLLEKITGWKALLECIIRHIIIGEDYYPTWKSADYETGYVPFPGSEGFEEF